MKSSFLNNEESKIMKNLEGLPQPGKIKILENSIASKAEKSGRRVLRPFVLKLQRANCGSPG
jgi:hypothetical protein